MKVPNALSRDDTEHGKYYYAAAEADLIIAELVQERDALKTDAERYRWLRESRHTSATAMTFCDVLDEWTPWAEPKYLDEAIDTQLQAALRKS